MRGQTGNSGRALWGPELGEATGSLPNHSQIREVSWFLIFGEGRGVSRSPVEGWLRWFTHCFVGGMFRGHAVTCFCSLLLRSGGPGFWSLCILLSMICFSCTCTQLFLVPYSFFVFCCWRRCFSSKPFSKGSQVQPVSVGDSFSSSRGSVL